MDWGQGIRQRGAILLRLSHLLPLAPILSFLDASFINELTANYFGSSEIRHTTLNLTRLYLHNVAASSS